MTELPLLRFIPFRRSDIVDMCLAEGGLDEQDRARFEQACALIEDTFQREFHVTRQRIKDVYAPMDPDADTRLVTEFREAAGDTELSQMLGEVLERANY